MTESPFRAPCARELLHSTTLSQFATLEEPGEGEGTHVLTLDVTSAGPDELVQCAIDYIKALP